MKELESKLAERDAMIRVLQKKHTFDKEVSSSYPSISLSHHTPHPSLNTTDLSNVLNAEDLGKHLLIKLPQTSSKIHNIVWVDCFRLLIPL